MDKIPITLFADKDTVITKGSLVTTLPVLPKQYEISFDFKPTKWIRGWSNIIHLSTNGNIGWGNRIPAFFPLGRKVGIVNALSGNGNYYFWSLPLLLKKWVHFRMMQRLEGGKYVYRVYMDGFLLREKVNSKAQDFKYVDVWVGCKWYNAQPGVIKNLTITGKNCFDCF